MNVFCSSSAKSFRVQLLLQIDAELFPKRLKVTQVFVVLAFVLDFGFDSL
jgi:hypothetical protein